MLGAQENQYCFSICSVLWLIDPNDTMHLGCMHREFYHDGVISSGFMLVADLVPESTRWQEQKI
jgi:hypothetical protein